MKAIWLSDLHLEFHQQSDIQKFILSLRYYDASAIFITGDTNISTDIVSSIKEIRYGSDLPVYFICGNHDFYHSSISSIRADLAEIDDTFIFYMHNLPFLKISEKTAIIGYDGWYDGELGDYANSDVRLNDFNYIKELTNLTKEQLLIQMRYLSDPTNIIHTLITALTECENIILLTHVPPFEENTLYRTSVGEELYTVADKSWLPFFSNGFLGQRLIDTMKYYPKRKLYVLSGHTHAKSYTEKENIICETLDAEYGQFPKPKIIEIE
jgi:predicted phosphohydrolase